MTELTRRSAVIVRAEIQDSNLEQPKMFDFVEMPLTNILATSSVPQGYPAKDNEKNKKFILDMFNALSQGLVMLQSYDRNPNLDQKKERKLNVSLLTQILKETLFMSYPCTSILNCGVTPEPQHRLSSLTALKFASQIRDHVIKQVSKCQMNRDIIGQSIETIDNELTMMQIKLEQDHSPMSNGNSERFHALLDNKNQTFGDLKKFKIEDNEEIYSKLKELIYCYKQRIRELRQEHKKLNVKYKKGSNENPKKGLEMEV